MVPYFKVRLWLENLEDRRLLAVFTVTNTDDASAGSLRQAILDANNNPGLDTIAFDIGGGGAQSIRPASPLPAITDRVIIDGTTQPGFDGSPLIELTGMDAGPDANGLTLQAGRSTIRGLVINSFAHAGISISSQGVNLVAGNYIGTDLDGKAALANVSGIEILGPGAFANTIGGTTVADRNLISGNSRGISPIESTSNRILGNYIGTDVTGNATLGNVRGIEVSSSGNIIGGTLPGAGNVISGNMGGIIIAGTSNSVRGNFIGTNATGTDVLTQEFGMQLAGRTTSSNTIGGTIPGARNLIAGSRLYGIGIGNGAADNLVLGNYIGTDVTGMESLGNLIGVFGGQTALNQIGGTAPGAGNLISGNSVGIATLGASFRIQGNYIGTDATGTVALGNETAGIGLDGIGSTVGGVVPGAGNLISGNVMDGLFLTHAENTLVQGNRIGTDVTGTADLGNGSDGINIDFLGHDNTIGGIGPGAGNLIAFNHHDGIQVGGGTGNAILRNSLFGNAAHGIELIGGGNLMEPAPVLTAVTSANGSTTIEGTLNSLPGSLFTLEFFVNSQCHPSGDGEGERFVTSITLPTDEDGTAEFSFTFRGELPDGQVLTATATDPDGNTSEFSACQDINRTGSPGVPGVNDEALAVALSKSLPAASRLRFANRDRLFIPRDQERAVPWTPRESDRPLEPIVRPPVSRRTEPGYDWLSGWLWEVEPGLELSTPSRADTL